jgi:hypothetical protein
MSVMVSVMFWYGPVPHIVPWRPFSSSNGIAPPSSVVWHARI